MFIGNLSRHPRRRLRVESLEMRCLLTADLAFGQADPAVFEASAEVAPPQIATMQSPLRSTASRWQAPPRSAGDVSPEGESTSSVHFRFVYPNDADPTGFFRDHPQRKALLETAGKLLTDRLADTLAAIPNTSRLSWTASYTDPGTGAAKSVPANFSVAANEIVIFVGARNLQGFDSDPLKLTRAYAEGIKSFNYAFAAGVSPAEVAAFDTLLRTRGEPNALLARPTDFAPILGSLTFDTRPSTLNNMYFEQGTFAPGQFRFLTFAQHELAHILGFGLAPSYFSQVVGSNFNGSAAKAVYGGPVPLAPPSGAHFNESVSAQGKTIMGAAIQDGQLFQELDYAALDDLGWELRADTRPAVTLTTSDKVLVEGAESFAITATLSAASTTAITLPLSLNGAAAGTTDVTLSAPSFVFLPNQTTATINVSVVNDTSDETTEAVTMTIAGSASVRLGNDNSFQLTIFDEDGVRLPSVARIAPASVGAAIDIPGDNKARAIVFRSATNRTLSILANSADPLSESVLLLDKDQNVVGTYGAKGLVSASLLAGQSYAVVFYPRQTARSFAISLPGGFATATARTNVLLRADVNGDSLVTEVDALQIINQLNQAQGDSSINAASITGEGYYDVSGDGFLTAVDALQVINVLNGSTSSASAGEPSGATGGFQSLENSAYAVNTSASLVSHHEAAAMDSVPTAEVDSDSPRTDLCPAEAFQPGLIAPVWVVDDIWREAAQESGPEALPFGPLAAGIELPWVG